MRVGCTRPCAKEAGAERTIHLSLLSSIIISLFCWIFGNLFSFEFFFPHFICFQSIFFFLSFLCLCSIFCSSTFRFKRSVENGFLWFRALILRTRDKQKPQPNHVERQQNKEEWMEKTTTTENKNRMHSTIIVRYCRRRRHHHRHWSVVKTELKFNILFFGY